MYNFDMWDIFIHNFVSFLAVSEVYEQIVQAKRLQDKKDKDMKKNKEKKKEEKKGGLGLLRDLLFGGNGQRHARACMHG